MRFLLSLAFIGMFFMALFGDHITGWRNDTPRLNDPMQWAFFLVFSTITTCWFFRREEDKKKDISGGLFIGVSIAIIIGIMLFNAFK